MIEKPEKKQEKKPLSSKNKSPKKPNKPGKLPKNVKIFKMNINLSSLFNKGFVVLILLLIFWPSIKSMFNKPYTVHFWRDRITKKYGLSLDDKYDPDCLWELMITNLGI